jgi:hypothetical protein
VFIINPIFKKRYWDSRNLLFSDVNNLGERGWDGVDWIDLAQDRDQWRALVNTVMNLRVP